MKLTKELVLTFASGNSKFKTSGLVAFLRHGVSRQYTSFFLNELVKAGDLVREGAASATFYALPENLHVLGTGVRKRYKNNELKEHEVLEELHNIFPSLFTVPENVRSIFDYAFSEMLNNAIEHSESKSITIDARKTSDNLSFEVNDTGIGVFNSVMQKRSLKTPLEAIQDLLKGKTTTQPKSHSGEGIFFTSKAGDVFVLESGNTRLRVDNDIKDVFVEEFKPSKKGTKVSFTVGVASRRHLNDVFKKYQTDPENPDFDKTEVLIKLFTMGTIYVSRSQARRVLTGLDKFKTIILDFDQVPTIGQAFADEVFRVFQQKHPEILISPVNMNGAVKFMVERVEKPSKL